MRGAQTSSPQLSQSQTRPNRRARPQAAQPRPTFKVEPQVALDLFQNREAIRQLEAKADEFDKLADSLGDTVDLRRLAKSYRAKADHIKEETEIAVRASLQESAKERLDRFFAEDR
jgi:hypothetical protein